MSALEDYSLFLLVLRLFVPALRFKEAVLHTWKQSIVSMNLTTTCPVCSGLVLPTWNTASGALYLDSPL